MKNDSLEEIWRVLEKLAARFDYDLHRMVVHLQKAQVKHGCRVVLAPKKTRLSPAKAGRINEK